MADRKRTSLDWEDIRFFVALSRHGSLSATARALSVNHATVSRRVASLEASLGERLLDRRPEGYVLTSAGTRVLGSANGMENAAAMLQRRSDDAAPSGLIRINAPPSLAHAFLISRIGRLTAEYPGLDLDLASELRLVSLERREADIAIRDERPRNGDVIAKRLASVGFGFYGSSKWQQRIRRGAEPVFVGFDEQSTSLRAATWLAQHYPRARISFRTDTQLGQAAAARADTGIAVLPHFLGREDDHLRPILLDKEPPQHEFWCVTRRSDVGNLTVRTITEFLIKLFNDERTHFE